MSTGEIVSLSLITSGLGMGTTFVVLILLMYIMKAMGYFLREKK